MGTVSISPLSGLNLIVTPGQDILGLGTPGTEARSDSPLSLRGSIKIIQK